MHSDDFQKALDAILSKPPIRSLEAVKGRLTRLGIEWHYDRAAHIFVIHNGNATTVLHTLNGVTDSDYEAALKEINVTNKEIV